jgi:hypothetical protein
MGNVGDTYPGTTEKRVATAPRPSAFIPDAPYLPKGRMLLINGVQVEFHGIGALAAVLGRKPVTVRTWEASGIIPTSGYTLPGKDRDVRGRRRLWTRDQVIGIWRIARDEGILDPGPRVNIAATEFTPRVQALFAELRAS